MKIYISSSVEADDVREALDCALKMRKIKPIIGYGKIPYLKTQHISILFGVCVNTLERWRKDRKGPPCRKIGKWMAYEVEKLIDWIVNQNRESSGIMPIGSNKQ